MTSVRSEITPAAAGKVVATADDVVAKLWVVSPTTAMPVLVAVVGSDVDVVVNAPVVVSTGTGVVVVVGNPVVVVTVVVVPVVVVWVVVVVVNVVVVEVVVVVHSRVAQSLKSKSPSSALHDRPPRIASVNTVYERSCCAPPHVALHAFQALHCPSQSPGHAWTLQT